MAVVDVFAQWILASHDRKQGAVMTELPTPLKFDHGTHPKLRWRPVDIYRGPTIRERNTHARRRFAR